MLYIDFHNFLGGARMKKTIAILLLALAVAVSANAAPASNEVLVGCLQDITGPTSTLGKMIKEGAQWAVDEINKSGGIKGARSN